MSSSNFAQIFIQIFGGVAQIAKYRPRGHARAVEKMK
jgi:hypothetical protein